MVKPEILMILKKGIRMTPFSYSERREPFAVIRCLDCNKANTIDLEQYEGKAAIQCNNCSYHETHNMVKAFKNVC